VKVRLYLLPARLIGRDVRALDLCAECHFRSAFRPTYCPGGDVAQSQSDVKSGHDAHARAMTKAYSRRTETTPKQSITNPVLLDSIPKIDRKFIATLRNGTP
jgi:hypothetical protein